LAAGGERGLGGSHRTNGRNQKKRAATERFFSSRSGRNERGPYTWANERTPTRAFKDSETPMDDFYSDEAAPATMTRNVVRRYERQSQNDFEIELFQGVLERDPDYVDVLRVLANNLAAKGDRDAGLELETRLVELRPNDAVAHYNLACSLSVLGHVDEAIDHLETALGLGYECYEDLIEDRDLTPLHQEPRFLHMIKRLVDEN
jgi:tetratricopeptide (TPR) repeat protein